MQKKSQVYANFPEGDITDRIVDEILKLPIHSVLPLIRNGTIRDCGEGEDNILLTLSHRNLSWDKIDEYANACNVPLQYFIYGDSVPQNTYYSCFDREFIPLLNLVGTEELSRADAVIRSFFPNPNMRIPATATPSAKIISVAFSSGKNLPDVGSDRLDRYSTDINRELFRLRECRKKERFIFRLDYLLDMCTYCHVSPHWIFSLSGPLLCQAPEADALFDLICLLPRCWQIAVMAMLVSLCPDAQQRLPGAAWESIQRVIAEEGGIARGTE